VNRRLLDRKAFFGFQKPFDIIPFYKSSCDKSGQSVGSRIVPSEKELAGESLRWSDLLNAARTFFERRSIAAPE
jgi:hypothetical protein